MHFDGKNMLLYVSTILSFQRLLGFLLEGVGWGLRKNDHEFPFLRIVELFEHSLDLVFQYSHFDTSSFS